MFEPLAARLGRLLFVHLLSRNSRRRCRLLYYLFESNKTSASCGPTKRFGRTSATVCGANPLSCIAFLLFFAQFVLVQIAYCKSWLRLYIRHSSSHFLKGSRRCFLGSCFRELRLAYCRNFFLST